jgi:hypothetical protein
MNVTLDDSATTDIHNYGVLTDPFRYQPDARNVSPLSALDTSLRTAWLSSFNGLDPNGSWTLFFADAASGDQSTLLGWSLEITAVPEPTTWALGIFATLAGVAGIFRQWRRSKAASPPQ